MMVEVVTPEALEQIADWRTLRGLPAWPKGWLSNYGYWVPGLAAGWLVPTASARALLEDFITDPRADKEQANAALFAVERRIADDARRLGYRYLIGTTRMDSIRRRVAAAGYVVSEPVFSLHQKELTP